MRKGKGEGGEWEGKEGGHPQISIRIDAFANADSTP